MDCCATVRTTATGTPTRCPMPAAVEVTSGVAAGIRLCFAHAPRTDGYALRVDGGWNAVKETGDYDWVKPGRHVRHLYILPRGPTRVSYTTIIYVTRTHVGLGDGFIFDRRRIGSDGTLHRHPIEYGTGVLRSAGILADAERTRRRP